MTAYGTIEDAGGATKRGARDFSKPVEPDHLLLLRRAVERQPRRRTLLKEEFAERLGFPRILGTRPRCTR
jgi:DNA-binding NtrC family response regulator